MIEALQAELECRADSDKKAWWENYVQGATFRGTPMAEIRSAVATWLKGRSELSTRQIKHSACELIRQPLSEDKLAGVVLSEHLIDDLGIDDLPAFRTLLADEHLGDWNSCDWFCRFLSERGDQLSSEARRAASAKL